jgi:hypothetical protein
MHHAPVHYDRTHADQYIIMNGAAMHQSIVADGNIIADLGWVFLVSAMDHCAILYVYFVAHFYIMNITTNHGVEPDAAFIAHYYISNNGCIGCYKTILAKLGCLSRTGRMVAIGFRV